MGRHRHVPLGLAHLWVELVGPVAISSSDGIGHGGTAALHSGGIVVSGDDEAGKARLRS